MNALVSFRSNTTGSLTATREQQRSAAETLSANLRSRLQGLQRASLAASGRATASKALATTATQAKTALHTEDAAVEEPQSALSRDAFLQLLVQQMKNQDPLEPMDNGEMIAQLAQLSALEEMEHLNSGFEAFAGDMNFLLGNIDQLNFITAQGLLGREVNGVNNLGQLISGTVESVTLNGSIVVLTVDGEALPMTGVLGIGEQVLAETPPEK